MLDLHRPRLGSTSSFPVASQGLLPVGGRDVGPGDTGRPPLQRRGSYRERSLWFPAHRSRPKAPDAAAHAFGQPRHGVEEAVTGLEELQLARSVDGPEVPWLEGPAVLPLGGVPGRCHIGVRAQEDHHRFTRHRRALPNGFGPLQSGTAQARAPWSGRLTSSTDNDAAGKHEINDGEEPSKERSDRLGRHSSDYTLINAGLSSFGPRSAWSSRTWSPRPCRRSASAWRRPGCCACWPGSGGCAP